MNTKNDAQLSGNQGFVAVLEAARLLRYCEQVWQDEADAAKGWQIDYAVDTDVVNMYSDPVGKADYAKVFDTNGNNNVNAALADLLGSFILNRLQANKNLWVISPHDEELYRVALAINDKAAIAENKASQQIEIVAQKIDAALNGNRESGSSASIQDQLMAALWQDDDQGHRGDFLSLIEWIDGKTGPQREYDRLSLLPKRRIKNLLHHPTFASFDPRKGTFSNSQFQTELQKQELKQFNELMLDWLERLRKSSPPKKPAYALRDDAKVMATLEWVNERSPAANKRKLILITGSENLFKAASDKGLKGSKPSKNKNIANEYLRDPRCFIGAKGFFESNIGDLNFSEPGGQAEEHDIDRGLNLVDWLNCFFPDILKEGKSTDSSGQSYRRPGTKVNFELLEKVEAEKDEFIKKAIAHMASLTASENHHSPVKFPQDLYAEWADTVVYTARKRNLSALYDKSAPTSKEKWREKFDSFCKKLNSDILKTNATINYESVKSYLQKEILSSHQEFTFVASMFGMITLLEDESLVCGIPALRFDRGRQAEQKEIDQLFDHLWDAQLKDNQLQVNLQELYAHLSNDDPYNYHAVLIHAVIFAAKGHWVGTRHLATQAWNIANQIKSESSVEEESIHQEQSKVIRGREAAYLLAVAARRLARTKADLEAASNWLKRATECEDDDRLEGPKDPRFLAEEFSIEMAKLQLDYFAKGNPIAINWALSEKIERCQSILTALSEDFTGPKRVSNTEVRSIRSWVKRQTLTLVFIAAVLAYEQTLVSNQERSLDKNTKKNLIDLLHKFENDKLCHQPVKPKVEGQKYYPDMISSFCYYTALILYSESEADISSAKDYFRERESTKTKSSRSRMAFEEVRENRFLNLIQLRLNSLEHN